MLNFIPPEDAARNLACYNGKYIVPKGRLIIEVESGWWIIQSAPLIIVDDKKAPFIIGWNILAKIGIKIVQDTPKHNQMSNIHKKNKLLTRN